MLIMDTLWKNNLNFEKDVPIVCVNFGITVITFHKKKEEAFCFTDLCTILSK